MYSFSDKENKTLNCRAKLSENKSLLKFKKSKMGSPNNIFQSHFDLQDIKINVIKEDPTELDSENKENVLNSINCENLNPQQVLLFMN